MTQVLRTQEAGQQFRLIGPIGQFLSLVPNSALQMRSYHFKSLISPSWRGPSFMRTSENPRERMRSESASLTTEPMVGSRDGIC